MFIETRDYCLKLHKLYKFEQLRAVKQIVSSQLNVSKNDYIELMKL